MARPLVLCLALLAFLASAGPASAANPVLPGDYPDPSVVEYGGQYVATATSDRWEPVFPVLTSTDLVSWTQVGAVFHRAPAWATGKRFWAPELTVLDGRLVLVYAAMKASGQWCIGRAAATNPAGPWVDGGPILCRDGGAIDPTLVRDAGTTYLVYKAKGVGGGLWAAPVDPYWFTHSEPPTPLLFPEESDRGVTEGPALLQHDGSWYLFFSTGNCCGPPCTYTQGVARAETLLGPYTRARRPVLPESATWRCTGHGTPVNRADGVFLLHHGYRAGDLANRRRMGVLTRLEWGEDGWPVAAGGVGELGPEMPVAPAQREVADDFLGPALDRAWQWVARRTPPSAVPAGGTLAMGCDRDALISRQIAEDSFDAAVTLHPPDPGPATPAGALLVRQRDGALRGVEVRDGTVRMVRRRGASVKVGRPLAVPRRRAVRVRLAARPGGTLAAYVQVGTGWRTVPSGPGATGPEPVRVALACRGAGTARFARFRVAAGAADARLSVTQAAVVRGARR